VPTLALTDSFCSTIKPLGASTDYFDETMRGLALRVTEHGHRSWCFHYQWPRDGEYAHTIIGSYPATNLAAARGKALKARAHVEAGNDPRLMLDPRESLVAPRLTCDINIPDWVPRIVHNRARDMYQRVRSNKPLADAIERLTINTRMRRVWTEILRKKVDGSFYSPVKLPAVASKMSALEAQHRACLEIFCAAVSVMQHPTLMQPLPSYRELAARLRADAKALEKRTPRKTFKRLAGPLTVVAKSYEELAKTDVPEDLREATIVITLLFADRFGPGHFRTIATIISVAFNRDVSADDVKNWQRADRVKSA
jgi:Arm DNA-binding domain